MRNRLAATLTPIFALTGMSALMLQVTWQRVISLHSGVDLASTTTVVAAFLSGLGIGALAGGWLADRLGPERSLAAFALANAGIGAFAWLSLLLFYDLYRSVASNLSSTFASFAFNFVILVVPTTLMGLSLPLVARAVTRRVSDAGPLIGRLYGINTLGAAAGAALAGWYLLGTFGFVAVTRVAATLNIAAALLIASVWWTIRGGDEPSSESVSDTAGEHSPERTAQDSMSGSRHAKTWPWFAIYGLTGAVALGFEQVFFRLIDTVMRSNSYSFAHVLTLYLLLFGAGSAIGARLISPTRDPKRWFLAMQFLVGVSAIAALIALVVVAPALGLQSGLRRYFLQNGYSDGFSGIDSVLAWSKVAVIYLGIPLGLMGLPVLLMGASYPFVQALVAEEVNTLGRRTGLLFFSNLVGNVAGTLLVGFVLLDALGTAGTYRLLAAALGVAGIAAAVLAGTQRRRRVELAVALGALSVLLVLAPSNQALWAFLHGVTNDGVKVSEGRSCAAVFRAEANAKEMLTVNGATQNTYPYDDFHVLIGLLPALAARAPRSALAIGLGAGSTTYGMLQDPRLEKVTTVELCAGEYDLLHRLAAGGAQDLQAMLSDPRYDARVGDGRKYLLTDERRYEVITVDTLRPTSAFSGSLYSREFYELVASRLTGDGLFAQWVPTGRIANSVAEVFPYISLMKVSTYEGSMFLIAGRAPFDLDAGRLEKNFDGIPAAAFSADQRSSLRRFLREADRVCLANGRPASFAGEFVNRDLRPRDEYFINNAPAPIRAGCV